MGWGLATPDPDEANNADSTDTMVVNEADLAIQKVGLPEKVYAGEQIRYEITVTNNGSSDARNVVVTDVLDDQVAFELSNGDCAYDAQTGEADCGYMPAGTSKSFYVWVRVDADVEPGTTIENTTVVESDTDDPDGTNNSVTIGNYVMSKADLRIVKFGKPDGEVRAGEYLTYTIIVDNLGPSWAWDVTVKEALRSSGDFRIVSIASSLPMTTGMDPGWYTQSADFEVALDDPLPVTAPDGAGRWIITLVVTANETQDIDNSAEVLAGRSEDPAWDNNYALVEHDITDVADLSVVKTEMGYAYVWGDDMFQVVPAEDSAIAGYEDGLAYTMVVRNDGPSTAENVVLQDRLPAWVIVNGYEATQGSCATGTPGSAEDKLTCGLGTIVPGGVVTVTVYGYVPH
ncbi:MAG: DUF11 domain-containing protein, partial [Chloroflexi bacterium]|nr:DUF11 domain-containing protein [Chloroflexota bacterium]